MTYKLRGVVAIRESSSSGGNGPRRPLEERLVMVTPLIGSSGRLPRRGPGGSPHSGAAEKVLPRRHRVPTLHHARDRAGHRPPRLGLRHRNVVATDALQIPRETSQRGCWHYSIRVKHTHHLGSLNLHIQGHLKTALCAVLLPTLPGHPVQVAVFVLPTRIRG